ncbi:hypothetical protein AC1031_015604 [Aphanomyces cochlioides]|nr:hypothetical protein AC1031_015604 [Aphanomyces cochlioides]
MLPRLSRTSRQALLASRSLERHMSMAASVPYFRRHVIVMDAQGNAEAWPKKLEMSDHVLSQYARAIESFNEATDPKPLGIAAAYPTNAQLSLSSQDTHEVVVFPENIRVSNVREGDIEFLTKHLLAESVDIAALETKLSVTELTGHHAFVCAHANRDYRCACAGPKLIEQRRLKTGRSTPAAIMADTDLLAIASSIQRDIGMECSTNPKMLTSSSKRSLETASLFSSRSGVDALA